jgi:hypothetical protein
MRKVMSITEAIAADLPGIDEFFRGNVDIACNFFEEGWRDVVSLMERNRRSSPIRVAKLPVRPALTNLDEAQSLQAGDDFLRFQNR